MKKDRVTLEPAAKDYGRRCESIGSERKTIADLQDAMDHPDFKKEHHTLLDRLARDQRKRKPLVERPLFARIQVGTHPDNVALRQALLDVGRKIGDWGSDILNKVNVAAAVEEVDLIVASNAELGYPDGCTVKQTYEAGLKLGCKLCSEEDAPQYLRQHGEDLALGEWILFAMEPIADSDGYLRVFDVGHDGRGRWLYGDYGRPDDFWNGNYRWAFRCK